MPTIARYVQFHPLLKHREILIFCRINEAYDIEIKGTSDRFQFDIEHQVLWQPDN